MLALISSAFGAAKLYLLAGVAIAVLALAGYAYSEHGKVSSLTKDNTQLTKDLKGVVAANLNNEILRLAAEARAARLDGLLADAQRATEARGNTLVTITKEIAHAAPAPANCPVVPASIRAVARVLRDAAGNGLPRRPGEAGDAGGADRLPVVTIRPR